MEAKYDEIIKGVVLAKILNLSERHLRRLAEENVIKKNGQNKYLFLESIHSYIEYLELKNDADVDLKDEKIREEIKKIKKDTELKALKISELKNQLHPAGVIEEVMTSMLVNIKGKLLSLPNKLAPAVIACDNLGEIQDIILTGISDTLTELSDYSPDIFKNKNFIDEDEEEEKINTKNKKENKNDKTKKRGRPKKSE